MTDANLDAFRARCLATCKRWRCTGKGDTQHYAHRCGFAPPPPPEVCSLFLGELGRVCGAEAVDLFLTGWRCVDHAPTYPTPTPHPTATIDGAHLITRAPHPYGTATTDPLGRDGEGWHVGRSGLPTRDRGE